MITDAVIICGGKGTRLTSQGEYTPKSLLEFGSQKLIDIQIQNLIAHGVRRIFLASGYKSCEIKKHVKSQPYIRDIELVIVEENEARGTGGALLTCKEFLERSATFVVYGDILFKKEALNRLTLDYEDMLIVTRKSNHPHDSDIVRADYENKVLEYIGKGSHQSRILRNICCTGIFAINHTVIPRLNVIFGKNAFHFDRDGIPKLLDQGMSIKRCNVSSFVQDVGTVQRLQDAQSQWKQLEIGSPPNRAIFIDRDGTINVDSKHIKSIDEFEMFSDVKSALLILRRLGFLIFIITNQPVLARGEIEPSVLEQIHANLERDLTVESECLIDEIYVCPHHPDAGFVGERSELKMVCNCRKPKTGLIEKCLTEYDIALENSWIVGDSISDYGLAKNLGIRFAAIRQPEFPVKGVPVFPDLIAFAHSLKESSLHP